jgi:hypothetical protein
VLAAALAATLALTAGQAWEDEQPDYEEESQYETERARRLSVWAFGGALFEPGENRNDTAYGGEVSYAWDAVELGLYGGAYKIPEGIDEVSPVLLLRLIQRFPTYRGLDAMFALGVGAGRVEDWDPWFQVTLGVRLQVAGPAFLSGEFSFEQNDLLRLVGGLGVSF